MNLPIAHRVFLVTGAVATTMAAIAGCSGAANNSAKNTTTMTGAPSSRASVRADPADPAVKEITDTFVTFFNGKTPADKKVGLVEKGQTFAPAIAQQAGSPMAAGSTATVSEVKLLDAAHATVTYTILINGSPALPGQDGMAVDIGGVWKVAAATYCGLLKMQGGAPAAC